MRVACGQVNKCRDKFVAEFKYLQSQATGALSTFLEFVTYEHLIKSISFVISSLIKGADVELLLPKCHPLGRSPHLKQIMTFENFENADGLVELYRTVRVPRLTLASSGVGVACGIVMGASEK